jgi:hypothetical protein
MSIDNLTEQDLVVLDLVRNKGVGNFAVVTDLHPRDDAGALAEIQREAEGHAPGYQLRMEYGLFSGKRGTRLALVPDSITLQDHFFDGFEGYFRQHYG